MGLQNLDKQPYQAYKTKKKTKDIASALKQPIAKKYNS